MKSLLGNGEQIKVYFFEKLLMERGELLFLSSLLAFSHPYLWEEKIFGDICSIWCFLLWDGLEQCGLSGTHRKHCIFPVLWIVGGAKQMTTNKKRLNEICELLGARAARARRNRRRLIVLLLITLSWILFVWASMSRNNKKKAYCGDFIGLSFFFHLHN